MEWTSHGNWLKGGGGWKVLRPPFRDEHTRHTLQNWWTSFLIPFHHTWRRNLLNTLLAAKLPANLPWWASRNILCLSRTETTMHNCLGCNVSSRYNTLTTTSSNLLSITTFRAARSSSGKTPSWRHYNKTSSSLSGNRDSWTVSVLGMERSFSSESALSSFSERDAGSATMWLIV